MSDGARLFRPEFRRLLMVMLGQGSLVALPLTATPVLTIWLMGGDGVFLQSLISLGVYLAWAVPMLAAATLAIHIGFPTLLGRHAMCLYTATGKPHWFAYRDIQRVDLNHS